MTSKLRLQPGERGFVLVTVLLSLLLLMALAAVLTTTTLVDVRLQGAFNRATAGFYAAESGLNVGMAEFRNIFLDYRVPEGDDFSPRDLDLHPYAVSYQLSEVAGNPRLVTIPAGRVFAGLNTIQYTYTADSGSRVGEQTLANVGTQFDVGYIPLFQFLAFYASDLEILPGAQMNLHGRIHTNGDLYLNTEDGAGLTIDDLPAEGIDVVQVTAQGEIYRGRKNTSACNGNGRVRIARLPGLNLQTFDCIGGASNPVPESTLAGWGGTMLGEIESISVPEPDIVARGAGEFWQRADLRIVLRLGEAGQLGGPASLLLPHSVEVQDATGFRDGGRTNLLVQFMTDAAYNAAQSSRSGTRPLFYTDVPAPSGNCSCTDGGPDGCNNTSRRCYAPQFASDARVYANNTMGDLDYRRGGFYNRREHKWMYLLNLNLHDLLDWNMRQPNGAQLFDPADTSDGGIVLYLGVDGPADNVNNYGARLFGSAFLPFPAIAAGGDPTGITVVTDQAMYVLGDYNTVNKQPAALIGDTVNVLSNNYFNPVNACTNDCQSNRALGDAARDAASTTVMAAFVGGVDDTRPGNYNGGLENYPRFHEDWGGRTMTYRGSFVSLGTPRHAQGPWCGTGNGCNIYNPPGRNFDYDGDFNDVRNLPPLTPRFVYVEQVLFSQTFL